MDLVEEIIASIKVLTVEDRMNVKAQLDEKLAMCSECWGPPRCQCWNDE